MRALHVHRIGGIGGSERHLLELLPALRASGVEAGFLGLDDVRAAPDPFYEELARRGVPFERLPCPRDIDPGLVRRMRRLVRAAGHDLVHTHLVHADVLGAIAVAGGNKMLVSTKHNDDAFRKGGFRRLERLITRRAAAVICITHALAAFNREVVGLPSAKLRVVHYGLDEPPTPWGPRGGPELPEEAPVLLAVGRLVRQKGIDVAVRALVEIKRDHPDAQLVVLGEGPLRSELEELARACGAGDAVHLPGRVGDVAWWLRRASVLVHPARWEGFGLAVLEAMLCSTPIVASGVSSIPEIVVDGETGLLVVPDDPSALAAATTALLDDPARAARLGEAGANRARAEFSVARMAERTLAVYEEAFSRARR